MNKKKGFSLVEVLAVIVVLAIIALIAVPLVGNQIETSRKAAFKDSVLEASKGLNIYLNRKQIKMTPGIEDGAGVSIETLKKEDLISKLISGRFVEIDDKVYAYFISDGNYCAYGPIDELTVSKECENLDPTAPIIEKDAFRLTSTTNSITVTVDEKKIYDNEFNDVTYALNVYLKSKKIKSQKQVDGQNTYTFEGLKENTEYSVELVVTNRAMKQSKQSKKISTFALKKPDFTVEPEGYSFQKNITIKYYNDNITNPKYYFKIIGDNNIVEISNNVRKCSNSSSNIFRPDPNSCNETTNKINSNTWYQTDDINQTMILKKNAIIIANTYDGVNYSDSNATLLVTSIDNTPPTNVDFSYIAKSNTITLVANGIDLDSGIYGYQFYLDGIGWTNIQSSNTYTFSPVLLNHTYKAKGRAINNTYNGIDLSKKSYSESKEKEIKTEDKPKIVCSTETKGWATEKKYTCEFPEGNYSNEYIRYSGNDIPDITNDENWNLYPSDSDFSIVFDTEGTEYLLVRVIDGVNDIDYVTYTISQIDRTAPTCIWSGESTEWRKSASIILGCEDKLSNGNSGSGCAISGSSWTYNNGEVKTADLSYIIKDNVGHKVNCSKTVNVYSDNIGPSCSWSGESTEWRKTASIKATCTDGGSGCEGDDVYIAEYENNGTTSIKETELSFLFKDNVGNSTTCFKSAKVYVDNIKPACESNGESTTWRKDATISVTCKDNNGGSGCDSDYSGWSKTIDSTTITYTHGSYSVKDNAGNETACKTNYDAYVDKKAPVISNITTKNDQTNSTVTVTFDATDSESGIKNKVCVYGEGGLKSGFLTSNNTCVFKGISDVDKYSFAIQVEDNVGNINLKKIGTSSIDFEIDNLEACTQSKTITINYSDSSISNPVRYFRTLFAGGTSDVNVYECGSAEDNATPGTCSTNATKTVKQKTWYKVEKKDGNPSITIKNPAWIVAEVYDNGKSAVYKSQQITQVSSLKPTITANFYKYDEKAENNIGAEVNASTLSEWHNYGYWVKFTVKSGGNCALNSKATWTYSSSGSSTINKNSVTNSSVTLNSSGVYMPYIKSSGARYTKFTASDIAGNTASIEQNLYIDTEKPEIPTSVIRQDSNTGSVLSISGSYLASTSSYTNKTLWWGNFSSKGTPSGIKKYEYSSKCTGKTTGDLNSNGYTYSSNNETHTFCIRAVNNVGTASDWSKPYYFNIDKVAPTLKIALYAADSSGNKTGGVLHTYDTDLEATNTWMKNGYYFDIATNSSDTGSGIKSMTWQYNNSEIYDSSYSKRLSTSTYTSLHNVSFTGSGIRYGVVKLTDNAGNTTTGKITVKVDNTAPKISLFSVSGTTLTAKSQDLGRGIVAYAFTKNSTTPADSTWKTITATTSTITKTYTATSNGTWYFHVKDANGNTSSKSVNVSGVNSLTYDNTTTSSIKKFYYKSTSYSCSNYTRVSANTAAPSTAKKIQIIVYHKNASSYEITKGSTVSSGWTQMDTIAYSSTAHACQDMAGFGNVTLGSIIYTTTDATRYVRAKLTDGTYTQATAVKTS